MEFNVSIPLFWFYIPAIISFLTLVFFILVNSSQDRSGAGMVGFAGIIVLTPVNLIVWLIYFACGMIFGIR